MTQEQDGTNQAGGGVDIAEAGIPDGNGGVITRTAPSTRGETFAGGTIVHNDVGESQEELMAAIEATIKPFEEGDIVTGTVVKIDKDETLLDIGYKSEGVIPGRELSIRNDVDPHQVVDIGQEIEALVLQKEDAEGRLILSKKRAQYERAWGRIEEIKARDGTVEGPVIEVVKGGLILDIGLRGFLPASLVEMRRVRDLQPYVGKALECRIIELDKNRNNVVLSRRKWLEESQAEQRQEFLTSLEKGEVRKGTVSSIVNFGAFVDLGGVDGLVHVSELSWKHVDHPSEVVDVGAEVNVEILDVDLERERVSLSLKATQEDPWRQFARRHEVGDIIEGRVTKLVPFGAFVEVDDAIEGLVHISELAERHVERAEDEVRVHDRIPVKIIDIDLERRRISLSRKQAAGATPGETEATTPEMELERETAGEAEAAAEAGTSPETASTPQSEDEIRSASELAPDIARELGPEIAQEEKPEQAEGSSGEAAPPEEQEDAERVAITEPAAPPESGEDVTAAEAGAPDLDDRISREEPESGGALGTDGPSDESEGESIEAIVADLKRERGQG